MRIGIDCTTLDTQYVGGLNSYTLGLLDGFLETGPPGISFLILASPLNQSHFLKYREKARVKIKVIRSASLLTFLRRGFCRVSTFFNSPSAFKFFNDLFFRREAGLMQGEIDLLYTPYLLNYYSFRVPTVSSMHDIQQVHFPEFFTKRELIKRSIIYGLTARHSTYLQASSHYIKSDFLEHFKFLKESQVIVIPEGVNLESFSIKRDRSLLQKYALPERFIFYPAQLWKHKNHITLFKAIKSLKDEGITMALVLTGAPMAGSGQILDQIQLNDINDEVFYLGKVPFDDLVALYQHSFFIVVPSLHESSSLPILEAVGASVPVIASSIPAIAEMSVRLNISLFEPYDYRGLAQILKDGLAMNVPTRSQVEHNHRNISYYTWENAAKLYIELFLYILKK